jgi:hypothetical protein
MNSLSVLDYWRRESLDKLIDLYSDPAAADPYHATHTATTTAYAPQIDDLVRLHRLARTRMAQTVLEFGIGFSTVVLADALAKNQRDFEALPNPPKIRNRNAFKLFSVDASQHWIAQARKRLPPDLLARVTISYSRVIAGTFNGRLCHYYETLPNVVADFIYLDGPSVKDIEGSVHGLDFTIDERTVMAADLLLMESTLLPGTFIVVDGRVNNARFLERNFQRPFRREFDSAGDVTTFELVEPPLGRHSVGLAAQLAALRRHDA